MLVHSVYCTAGKK